MTEKHAKPIDLPLEFTCVYCGQASVTRDAWVEWNVAAQAWMISTLFDFAFCHQCHRRTRLLEGPARSGAAADPVPR